MTDTPRFIDLSHPIEHGMTTLKGFPAPVIADFRSRSESRAFYGEGTEFQIGRIEMVANTGTYVDAPFHRDADGADIARLPLDKLAALEGVVLRYDRDADLGIGRAPFEELARREAAIPGGAAAEEGVLHGKAVLVHTGFDEFWRTGRYYESHPFLTGEAAEYLVECGVALVGIDTANLDDATDGQRPAHTQLLRAGVVVAEHLCNLHQLPERGFRFFAVPAPVHGIGSFPVRAFAMLDAAAHEGTAS